MEMDVDQQQIPSVKLSRIWDGSKRLLARIENPVLVTLLVSVLLRLISLPGAYSGIAYFVSPDWNKLADPATWHVNIIQCLVSIAVGLGSIVLFSAYNPFKHHVFRDAIIISLMNLSATFLAGLAIFSVVGNLAFETGRNVSDVVDGGRSFTFASHSDVVAKFTFVPRLVAVMFFLMMFALDISGAVTAVGAVVTVLYGGFPSWKRWMLTTITSLVGFVAGLVYVSPSNLFILHITDYSGGGFVILFVMAIHVATICFFNGSFSWTEVRRFLLHSPASNS